MRKTNEKRNYEYLVDTAELFFPLYPFLKYINIQDLNYWAEITEQHNHLTYNRYQSH